MKGANFDDDKSFFSKFQPVQQQQQFQYQMNSAIAQKRECNSDDVEVDSRSTAGDDSLIVPPLGSSTDVKKQKTKSGGAGDEVGSIEMVRRPRGRPLGSKNKPKPPGQANKDTASVGGKSEEAATMRPYVLEISPGHDIVEALARFSRHRKLGISVLSGTGPVSNATIREPSSTGGSTITFRGRFNILSISATFLPPSFAVSSHSQSLLVSSGGMSVSIAGPQGQIVGGSVSGPLVAAGTVMIVAASFSNPCFHQLPLEDEQSVSVSGDGTVGRSRTVDVETISHHHHNHHHQPFQQQQQLQQQHQQQHIGISSDIVGPTSLSGPGMPAVYSGNLGNDVIWTPTGGRVPPSLPPRY